MGFIKDSPKKQAPALLLGICIFLFCNLSLIIWRKFYASSLIVDQLLVITFGVGSIIGFLFCSRRIVLKSIRIGLSRSLVLWVSMSALSSFLIFGLAVPGAIQRSKSAHVILWVGESRNGITKTELQLQLERKFGELDFVSIDMRLSEQESRGLLDDAGGLYVVTKRGRVVLETANLLAQIYSLPGWRKSSLLNTSRG